MALTFQPWQKNPVGAFTQGAQAGQQMKTTQQKQAYDAEILKTLPALLQAELGLAQSNAATGAVTAQYAPQMAEVEYKKALSDAITSAIEAQTRGDIRNAELKFKEAEYLNEILKSKNLQFKAEHPEAYLPGAAGQRYSNALVTSSLQDKGFLPKSAAKAGFDVDVQPMGDEYVEGESFDTVEDKEVTPKIETAWDKVVSANPPEIVQNALRSVPPTDPDELQLYYFEKSSREAGMPESDLKSLNEYNKLNEKYRQQMLLEQVPKEIDTSNRIKYQLEVMEEAWPKIKNSEKGWLLGNAPPRNEAAQAFDNALKIILLEEIKKLKGQGPISDRDVDNVEKTISTRKLDDEGFKYITNSLKMLTDRTNVHGEFMSDALTPKFLGGKGLGIEASSFMWNNFMSRQALPIQKFVSSKDENKTSSNNNRPNIKKLLEDTAHMSKEELEAIAGGK